MYKLYDFLPSGNGYKVRLLLNQLDIAFTRVEVNILAGQTHTQTFLDKNPNGKIPVLEIAPNRFLAESNAILFYLSQNTIYFPKQSWHQAQVMQWLFFEQYSHEPNIATPRYWITILGKEKEYQEQLKLKRDKGYFALEVMEKHLQTRSFFVNNHYSIADISLYAYTHVAEEGGFDLTRFPSIQRWLKLISEQPRYIPLDYTE